MPFDPDDPRLTAYALGELAEAELTEFEVQLADDPTARQAVEEIRATAQLLTDHLRREPTPGLAPAHHLVIEHRLRRRLPWRIALGTLVLATAAAVLLAVVGPQV